MREKSGVRIGRRSLWEKSPIPELQIKPHITISIVPSKFNAFLTMSTNFHPPHLTINNDYTLVNFFPFSSESLEMLVVDVMKKNIWEWRKIGKSSRGQSFKKIREIWKSSREDIGFKYQSFVWRVAFFSWGEKKTLLDWKFITWHVDV